MIIDFLNALKNEYQNKLEHYQSSISRLNMQISENQKLISLLESESARVFRDFTPREIGHRNTKRISELREETDRLLVDKNSLNVEFQKCSSYLKQIDEGILEVRELEMYAEDSKWYENHYYNAGDINGDPSEQLTSSSNSVSESIRDILDYILDDPVKAKFELERLI